MYKAPRGTADILPQDQPYWRHIERTAGVLCQLYGYERINTPVFEETGLFVRSVGPGSDIVEKEMYTFQDLGGGSLTLRPEGTAPVCRAYLEHGLHNRPQPVRLYYLAAIFRYERPQAGRYRQHQQFGFEAIGDGHPVLDAEVISMAWQLYRRLGLKGLRLHLNSIGCKLCRPGFQQRLRDHFSGNVERLCPDCRSRLARNALRLLDCKQPSCQALAEAAPRSLEHVCPQCALHFEQLQKYLALLELPYELDHRLVRGLDYYTRTVFEIQPEVEGSQNTLGGGGRYDDLIEELGGRPTPAVGFATGIERIVLNLRHQQVSVPELPHPRVWLAHQGEAAREEALKLAQRLRLAGIAAIEAPADKSLKAQLRQASAMGAEQVVILGEAELASGTVTLRDMAKGEQRSITQEELVTLLSPFAIS